MLNQIGIGDLFAGWSIFWILVLGLAAFIFTEGSWREVAQMIALATGVALVPAALMTAAMHLAARI